MKSAIVLLAASTCARANWLRWSGEEEPVWTARETGYVAEEEQVRGWTPKPTQAPGARRAENEVVLDVLKRAETSNTWINSETCGWLSGLSSDPWTCGNNQTCATNSQHVVACVSGTLSPFFSVCLDHSAFKNGACSGAGQNTGCCQQSDTGACGTYIWTGEPPRSMYRCFSSATIISVLDVPQFVIDASLSSKSQTPSTTTGTDGGAVTATGDIGTDVPTSAADAGGGGGGSSSTNIGAIVGGVVGGVAALALLVAAVAFYLLRKKRRAKGKHASSAVPPTAHNAPPHPGMGAHTASYTSTTFPPNSPWSQQAAAATATPSPPPPSQGGYHHDPRVSMVSKSPHEQPRMQPQPYQSSVFDPNAVYYTQAGGGGGGGGYPDQHQHQPLNSHPPHLPHQYSYHNQQSYNANNSLHPNANSNASAAPSPLSASSSPLHSPGYYQYPQMTGGAETTGGGHGHGRHSVGAVSELGSSQPGAGASPGRGMEPVEMPATPVRHY